MTSWPASRVLHRCVLLLRPRSAGAQAQTRRHRARSYRSRPRDCALDSLPAVGQVVFLGGGVSSGVRAAASPCAATAPSGIRTTISSIGHAVYDEPRFHVTSDFLNVLPERRARRRGGKRPRDAAERIDARRSGRGVPACGPARSRRARQMIANSRPTITIVEKDSTGTADAADDRRRRTASTWTATV